MGRWITAVAVAVFVTAGVSGAAEAACLKKAAVATAGSEKQAQWFALETMVQAVSWGIWPAFVANGSTPGYRIAQQKYRCKPDAGGVTCQGQATFCPTTGVAAKKK